MGTRWGGFNREAFRWRGYSVVPSRGFFRVAGATGACHGFCWGEDGAHGFMFMRTAAAIFAKVVIKDVLEAF